MVIFSLPVDGTYVTTQGGEEGGGPEWSGKNGTFDL